jgi:uncharacterized protein YkwD
VAAAAPSLAGDGAAFFSAAACTAGALALTLTLVLALVPGVTRAAERVDPAAAAAQIVELTNVFRSTNGLDAVATNRALSDSAQRFAGYMAETDRYGHEADGRRPADRALAAGYEYCAVAENIAFQFSSAGFATEELARRVLEGWEQSPGHRRNMLLPTVVDIGVGVARSERTRRWYAVQLFGRPKSASIGFAIGNRADAAIRYELDGETHALPPRVTRTHEGCFAGELRVLWPDGSTGPAFAPRDGARYVVQRDQAGQLRLQTQAP